MWTLSEKLDLFHNIEGFYPINTKNYNNNNNNNNNKFIYTYPYYGIRQNYGNAISDFQVAFRLCFKASPGAKPFIWKLILFTVNEPRLN